MQSQDSLLELYVRLSVRIPIQEHHLQGNAEAFVGTAHWTSDQELTGDWTASEVMHRAVGWRVSADLDDLLVIDRS